MTEENQTIQGGGSSALSSLKLPELPELPPLPALPDLPELPPLPQVGSAAQPAVPAGPVPSDEDAYWADLESRVEEHNKQFSYATQMSEALEAGWKQRGQNATLNQLARLYDMQGQMNSGEYFNKPGMLFKIGEEAVEAGNVTPEQQMFLKQQTADDIKVKQEEFVQEMDEILNPMTRNKLDTEDVPYPPHPAMVALQEANASGDQDRVNELLVKYFPSTARDVVLQSLAQMGPEAVLVPGGLALAGRVVGGAAMSTAGFTAGVPMVSFGVEQGASFKDFLIENGLDPTKPESIEEVLSDKELIGKARKHADAAGASVAVWDALGALAVTNRVIPPVLKKKLLNNFAEGLAQLGIQVGTGVAGEATKQLVTEGEITSPLDLKLEGVGELGAGSVEIATFKLIDQFELPPDEIKTVADVINLYLKEKKMTTEDLVKAMQELNPTEVTQDSLFRQLSEIGLVSPATLKNLHSGSTQGIDFGDQLMIEDSEFTDSTGRTIKGAEILNDTQSRGRVVQMSSTEIERTATARQLENLRKELNSAGVELMQAKATNPEHVSHLEARVEAIELAYRNLERAQKFMNQHRPAMLKFITDVVQTLMPGEDVIITEDITHSKQEGSLMFGWAGNNQFYGNPDDSPKRTLIIGLNPTDFVHDEVRKINLEDVQGGDPANWTFRREVMHTLTHELGHAIMNHWTEKLPAEVAEILEQSYRNWMSEAVEKSQTIGEFLRKKKIPWQDIPFQTYRDLQDLTEMPNKPYNFGFNEFIADLVGRQFSNPDSLIGDKARQHVPRLAALYQALFNKHARATNSDKTINHFMEWIKLQETKRSMEKVEAMLSESEKAMPAGKRNEEFFRLLDSKEINLPKNVRDDLGANLDRYNKGMRYFETLLQLAKDNLHIKPLQDYVTAVHHHWVTKSTWNNRAMETLRAWNKLGRKNSDQLGRLMLEETLESTRLARRLSNEEREALIKKLGLDFGKEASLVWETYRRIKSDFDQTLDKLYQIERKRIDEQYAEFETGRVAAVHKLDKIFDTLRNRDYFPLSRFGRFGVNVRAKKGAQINGQKVKAGTVIYSEIFEREGPQKKAYKELQKQYGKNTFVVEPFLLSEEQAGYSGLPVAILNSLRDDKRLGLSFEQKKAVNDLIDKLSPTSQMAARMLQRKGVRGFSHEATRAYANYMMNFASHVAKIEHGAEMDAAIKNLEKSAAYLQSQGIMHNKRVQITDHVKRHKDYLFSTQNEWDFLKSLAFHWHLGFNPKSAIVNLTQIPLVTYPYLAARKAINPRTAGLSDAFAQYHLTKAIKDLGTMFYAKKRGNPTFMPEVQEMLSVLQSEGIIDESLATDLANEANSGLMSQIIPNTSILGEKAIRAGRKVVEVSPMMFQMAEKFNRRITAIATYNMARSKEGGNMSHAEAINEAREALRSTQFEYARWNRPAFMRGKAGAFFVFMQYLQNILYFIRRDPGALRYIFMLFAAAGIMGLPGAEDIDKMIKKMQNSSYGRWFKTQMGYDDLYSDNQRQLRNYIETIGLDPYLVMNGLASRSFGLGHEHFAEWTGVAVPSISLTGSIGMGRILPPLDLLLADPSSGGSLYPEIGNALGAAYSIPMNIMLLMKDKDPDTWRAFERVMPTAMKNVSQAYRIYSRDEGKVYDRSRRVVTEFDLSNPTDRAEIVLKGLGFQPSRMEAASRLKFSEGEMLKFYRGVRTNLMNNYAFAMHNGDEEAIRAVTKKWNEVNRMLPPEQRLTNIASTYIDQVKRGVFFDAGIGNRILDTPTVRAYRQAHPYESEVIGGR